MSVNFQPAVYGKSVEGLAFAQVVSSSALDAKVSVRISVKELSGFSVVVVKTAPFIIHRGLSPIDRVAFANAQFSFGDNRYGTTLRQSGQFAEGEYEFCFEVEVLDSKDAAMPRFAQQCFVHSVQPLTPLLLLHPIDQDQFCLKRPHFTWQPPLPLPPSARFRLTLTEVREKQDLAEALAYNPPLVNQYNLQVNSLVLPPNAPDLKEGGRYAWQVVVYDNNTILKKSEVWAFTVQCRENAPVLSADSYRELKENEDGNFYTTDRLLPFSLVNPYGGAEQLAYSIECVSDPAVWVKNLPALKLAPGLNKYILDLSELRTMKEGQEYTLNVQLPNRRQLRLRFTYKQE